MPDLHSSPDTMRNHLTEISVDDMLNDYIRGIDDPPEDAYDQFYYDDTLSKVRREWEINPKVCQMVESVAATAKDGPSIFVRDISLWQLNGQTGRENSNRGTKPDCAIHFDNDRTRSMVIGNTEAFMKKSRMNENDKAVRKDSIGRRSRADIVIPIESKINHDASAFEFTTPNNLRFLRDNTQGGRTALKRIAEYVTRIFGYQHRTHVYAVYLFRNQARILYFDRSGAVVTRPFLYGTREHSTLHRFFWKVARMTREQLGFDSTATLASQADIDKMCDYAVQAPTEYLRQKLCAALSSDPMTSGTPKVPRLSQWPIYEVIVGGRKLLVGRPAFSSGSLFGRCTRGYMAFDVNEGEAGALRFLKDSWRVDSDRVVPEHKVYNRLEKENVKYMLTCLCGEDVHNTKNEWQTTRCEESDSYGRGHYRILLKEVCRPLTDFRHFQELAKLLSDAMIAHEDAWMKAGVLHRDVSINNILIYEERDAPQPVRTGLLSDWDLCKCKEDMAVGMEARQPNHIGTWYFRSAVSQCYPCKPYQLSDDIESFVHVYHYCVLRFHETAHTKTLSQFVASNYVFEEIRAIDGAHVGSEVKFSNMLNPCDPIHPKKNHTLKRLLEEMATLCARHYATIDEDEYCRLYEPGWRTTVSPTSQLAVNPDSESMEGEMRENSGEDSLEDSDTEDRLDGIPAVLQKKSDAEATLCDHRRLLELLLRYGLGVRIDGHATVVAWPRNDLRKSKHDFFMEADLLPGRNSAFSSSVKSQQ